MSPLSSIAIPWGWRSRGSLNIPSKKTSALSRGSTGSKVLSHLCSGGMTGLSGWDVRRYGLVRVREALLGHEGVTARVSGVPVVRISSQLLIELCVFVQLVPIQADAQPGAIGDLDRATLVLEHASVDDVVFRQSYPEGREQTAVYHVLRSRHKARLRAGEEADHLGDLFWPGNPSQGKHPAPLLNSSLDRVLPLEQIR